MSAPGPVERIAQDIQDLVRRIGQHRTMLARMAAVQAQALAELKELLRRAGGLAPEGMTPAEVEEEIRATALLREIVSGRAAQPSPSAPRVLLVGDDPTTRNLVSHFLRKENIIVEKAAGGSEGLARAKSGRPDLLIVDAAVPGMNGFELLTLLKKDPETAGLPILLLSSLDEEEAIAQSLDVGANYINKPFSPRILVAKVKKILRDACPHAVDPRRL